MDIVKATLKARSSSGGVCKSLLAIMLVGFSVLLSSTAISETETITWVLTDHLGSPVVGRDNSYSGRRWAQDFTPFGERIQFSTYNLGPRDIAYTGHYFDYDMQLLYAGARWYDPRVGRFLSPDPVRFGAGGVSLFNRYTYASNSPFVRIDPDGGLDVRAHDLSAGGRGYEVIPAPGALEKGAEAAGKKFAKTADRIGSAASGAADVVAGKPASWSNKGFDLDTIMRKWNEAEIDGAAIYGYSELNDGKSVVNGLLTRKEVTDFIEWASDNIEGFSGYGYSGIVDRADTNLDNANSRLNKFKVIQELRGRDELGSGYK